MRVDTRGNTHVTRGPELPPPTLGSMNNDQDGKPEVGRLLGARRIFMYGDAEKRGSEPPLVAYISPSTLYMPFIHYLVPYSSL